MTNKQLIGFSLLFLLLFLALAALMQMESESLALWPLSALPVPPDELIRLNQ